MASESMLDEERQGTISETDAKKERAAFAIIVPCYNEQDGIGKTLKSLVELFRESTRYELIVVDDGSTDATARQLEDLQALHNAITVVRHPRNQGYGAALKTGIRRATAELIAITDADGTYPNHRLPELLELARETDMVVGARTAVDVTYPFIRKIPKYFLKRYASWMVGQDIPDINSGMRVFRRDVALRFFNILPDGFSFTTTITLAMLNNRFDVRFVPIGYSSRIGKSKIKPIRDTLRFVQLILRTGMYFSPLRVFLPISGILWMAFLTSLGYNIFVLQDLTESTLLLLLFSLNTGMFALLADMIDKRSH